MRLENKIALTVKQAADAMSLSVTQMYRLIKNGEIPHKRVGGRILLSRKELEEFMSSNGGHHVVLRNPHTS